MNRRRFLLASLISLGWPRAAGARGAETVHRVGMLETRSLRLNAANVDAFR